MEFLLQKKCIMEVTAVVIYKGALAYYNVSKQREDAFNAHLIKYNGHQDYPPQHILLTKEGRHWTGNVSNKELLDDLGYAAELEVKRKIEEPFYRKRDGSHPSA